MKKLTLSIMVIFLIFSSAEAEVEIYDANGAFLGILLRSGSDNSTYRDLFEIYNPTKGYFFKLNTFWKPGLYSPPGDIEQIAGLYFTKPDCKGGIYANEYAGLLNAVVKYKNAYYKVTGGSKSLKTASYDNFGCHNGEMLHDGFMSKISLISKPFAFIPAKPPFTTKYVVSTSATNSTEDTDHTDSDNIQD